MNLGELRTVIGQALLEARPKRRSTKDTVAAWKERKARAKKAAKTRAKNRAANPPPEAPGAKLKRIIAALSPEFKVTSRKSTQRETKAWLDHIGLRNALDAHDSMRDAFDKQLFKDHPNDYGKQASLMHTWDDEHPRPTIDDFGGIVHVAHLLMKAGFMVECAGDDEDLMDVYRAFFLRVGEPDTSADVFVGVARG